MGCNYRHTSVKVVSDEGNSISTRGQAVRVYCRLACKTSTSHANQASSSNKLGSTYCNNTCTSAIYQ